MKGMIENCVCQLILNINGKHEVIKTSHNFCLCGHVGIKAVNNTKCSPCGRSHLPRDFLVMMMDINGMQMLEIVRKSPKPYKL